MWLHQGHIMPDKLGGSLQVTASVDQWSLLCTEVKSFLSQVSHHTNFHTELLAPSNENGSQWD